MTVWTRALPLAALLCLLVTAGLPAQDDAFTSRKARAAKQAFDRSWGAAEKAHGTAVLGAQRAYLRTLQDARKELMKAGDLEEAQRVTDVAAWLEGSIKELEGGQPPRRTDDRRPLRASGPVAAQRTYQAAAKTAGDVALRAKTDALMTYHQALDAALTPILNAGKDLDEAKRIQGAIRRVAARIDALEATSEWMVIFRGDDPAIWNTAVDGDGKLAIPVVDAPREMRFLRLKRVDTGEAVIIPLSYEQLGKDAEEGRYGWCGAKTHNSGGLHLGIDDEQMPLTFRDGGRIMIHNKRSTSGWGFGHAVHKNDVQYFAWNGRELPRTVFEISVTLRDLNADEEKELLGSEAPPTPRSPLDDDEEVSPEDFEGGDKEIR